MTAQRHISFSPPDITESEIAEVVDALRSGWITTGPKTKQFEQNLSAFTGAARSACLSSATAALECALRALGIGAGDEVITSAYTYTATCSPICHVGATPVLCDTAPHSYEMDYDALEGLITKRTKALIVVDIAGRMCDYDRITTVLENARNRWRASTERQEAIGGIALIADAAHALGATRKGYSCGTVADLTTFSFHAVKNLTTAEGGALCWRSGLFDDDALYQNIMLQSLHGQTKDALSKTKAGSWEYDIAFPGWKCNMTDLQASIGLAQLRRYPAILARRRAMVARYEGALQNFDVDIFRHYETNEGLSGATLNDKQARHSKEGFSSSGHLMLVRTLNKSQTFRNALIERMAEAGVATNVHYKPLPMLSAYRRLGFNAQDFPCACAQFENEITLPLHTLLSDDDIDFVTETFARTYKTLETEGIG